MNAKYMLNIIYFICNWVKYLKSQLFQTGTCALFFAAQGGFLDIVKLLLDSGASVDLASYVSIIQLSISYIIYFVSCILTIVLWKSIFYFVMSPIIQSLLNQKYVNGFQSLTGVHLLLLCCLSASSYDDITCVFLLGFKCHWHTYT